MMSEVNQLLNDLEELKKHFGEKESKRLELDLLKRVVQRSAANAEQCDSCRDNLQWLQSHIQDLLAQSRQENPATINKKEHHRKIQLITSHLKDEHKLITEGYYASIYMSLGMSLGLLFGLTVMDNLALGLPLGMVIGMAIGAGLDANAKKKGNVI